MRLFSGVGQCEVNNRLIEPKGSTFGELALAALPSRRPAHRLRAGDFGGLTEHVNPCCPRREGGRAAGGQRVGIACATSNKTNSQFEFVPFQVRGAILLPPSSPRGARQREAAIIVTSNRISRGSNSSFGRGRETSTWPRAARPSWSARWPTGPGGCSGPKTDSRSVSKADRRETLTRSSFAFGRSKTSNRLASGDKSPVFATSALLSEFGRSLRKGEDRRREEMWPSLHRGRVGGGIYAFSTAVSKIRPRPPNRVD